MKKLFAIFFAAFFATNPSFAIDPSVLVRPKNIILLISDGAGLSQISHDVILNDASNYKKFKNIGLVTTHSATDAITDSAAAATAFATGKKTFNGAISLDESQKPLTTIFEIAKKQGLATGLVVTSSVTHATPAAFVAHQKSRKMDEEIARDFAASDIDVFIGGGLKYFKGSKVKPDLTLQLKQKGYKIYENSVDLFSDNYQGKIAALVAKDHLPKMSEGRADYAVQALDKSLKILSQNKKGFILMFEGSQIDWGGHQNDVDYVKQEMQDFDKVIGAALEFADKNKNTLVIVVSDHETGGFALTGDQIHIQENYGKIAPKFTSTGHSAAMIPLFAYGPQATIFNGLYDNTEVFNKMVEALNLKR